LLGSGTQTKPFSQVSEEVQGSRHTLPTLRVTQTPAAPQSAVVAHLMEQMPVLFCLLAVRVRHALPAQVPAVAAEHSVEKELESRAPEQTLWEFMHTAVGSAQSLLTVQGWDSFAVPRAAGALSPSSEEQAARASRRLGRQ
jgi:hypothetical protein